MFIAKNIQVISINNFKYFLGAFKNNKLENEKILKN